MRPVLKRIAVNGLLTAAAAGVIGYLLSQLAGMWLAASATTAPGPAPGEDAPQDALRRTLPVSMALWAFGLVAVGELVLAGLRRRPKPTPPPVETPVDPAEALLEELLTQAESAIAGETQDGMPVVTPPPVEPRDVPAPATR